MLTDNEQVAAELSDGVTELQVTHSISKDAMESEEADIRCINLRLSWGKAY